jgi:phosphatidylserine/phosphatidylglycerophosphate/cardiolipin synthase-like enzyme
VSIALSSIAAFTAAVVNARSVEFASYTLGDGAVRDALETAARAGAHVRVRLERDPFADPAATLHRTNAKSLARLAAAGADAASTAPGEPLLHLKAAVVDGVAWLDDRNWAGGGSPETIVRDDDPADVRALAAVLTGGAQPPDAADATPSLALTKASAQRLELGVVAAAANAPLALASESFGSGAVESALTARAKAGLPTRLLVAGREAAQPGISGNRERACLAKLAAAGVVIRVADSRRADGDEKLAVTDGRAWTGSANATYAGGSSREQREWGLATSEPRIVDGLRRAFESAWLAARPLPAGQT